MNPPRQRAFTLVELLVVIAIFAVLASLLLPALAAAKQRADIAVCVNNLRQQSIALAGYVGDNAAYPIYQTELLMSPSPRYRDFWPQLLESHSGATWPVNTPRDGFAPLRSNESPKGTFACPGYNKVHGVYSRQTQGIMGAYAYNAWTGGIPVFLRGYEVKAFGLSDTIPPDAPPAPGGLTHSKTPVPEGSIAAPSRMIALLDSQITEPSFGATGAIWGLPWATYPSFHLLFDALPPTSISPPSIPLNDADRATQQRHGGRFQMGFCDGHVESGKPKQFFNFANDEVVKLWSIDHQAHRL